MHCAWRTPNFYRLQPNFGPVNVPVVVKVPPAVSCCFCGWVDSSLAIRTIHFGCLTGFYKAIDKPIPSASTHVVQPKPRSHVASQIKCACARAGTILWGLPIRRSLCPPRRKRRIKEYRIDKNSKKASIDDDRIANSQVMSLKLTIQEISRII